MFYKIPMFTATQHSPNCRHNYLLYLVLVSCDIMLLEVHMLGFCPPFISSQIYKLFTFAYRLVYGLCVEDIMSVWFYEYNVICILFPLFYT